MKKGLITQFFTKNIIYSLINENSFLSKYILKNKALKTSSKKSIINRENDIEDLFAIQLRSIPKNEHVEIKKDSTQQKFIFCFFISEHKLYLVVIIICSVIKGDTNAILAVLISIIAKKLSSTDPSVISKEASFYSLILVVFGSLISFIKNYFFLYEGENMMNKIKLVMFDKFIKMDISFYYNNENK